MFKYLKNIGVNKRKLTTPDSSGERPWVLYPVEKLEDNE